MQRNTARSVIVGYQKAKHKNDDSTLWSDIGDVFHILNGNGRKTGDGASEDESDVEERTNRKVVQVLRRDWINKSIPRLMHAVDTYAQDNLDEAGRLQQGNTSFERAYLPKNEDKRMYMTGLPRNFYDDTWYKKLDDIEKRLVNARDHTVNIPTLVSTVRS